MTSTKVVLVQCCLISPRSWPRLIFVLEWILHAFLSFPMATPRRDFAHFRKLFLVSLSMICESFLQFVFLVATINNWFPSIMARHPNPCCDGPEEPSTPPIAWFCELSRKGEEFAFGNSGFAIGKGFQDNGKNGW